MAGKQGSLTITKFEKARRSKGYSNAKLAKELGISESLISQVQTGQRQPYPKLIAGICQVLKLKPEQVFTRKQLGGESKKAS